MYFNAAWSVSYSCIMAVNIICKINTVTAFETLSCLCPCNVLEHLLL
jgi:hypothetical protein